jgi:pyruvate formate lyase activating enzyme
MKGIIFSVKRYAIHDGPGIRVTFFMKGCPLSCWWCHNPEGISPEPEEFIQTNRVGDKEFSRRSVVGKPYDVKDLLSILAKERVFFEKSGGGVTFSGGEPLMQSQFLLEALIACKEAGYHTAVDTSGHYPSERLFEIMPYTDLFLYDMKHSDPSLHEKYTGVSNGLIMNNLKIIIENRKEVMLRIPVVPEINDGVDHLAGFIDIINSFRKENVKMINLLPYHRIGSSKYLKFKRPNRMEGYKQPTETRMNDIKKLFETTGIRVRIGG